MDPETFRRFAHEAVDWAADYLRDVEALPVRSPLQPGALLAALPPGAPERGEPTENLLRDFRELVLPGITHWNHPRFFAYFPANNSGPSILGELLAATLGVNAMMWETSPAATELEQRVMDWLRQLLDLPPRFAGVIQDTASTATLCALLAARERITAGAINQRGFAGGVTGGALRVYTSEEGHSSIEKGVRIAGFGSANLVRVPTDGDLAMDPVALARLIEEDRRQGLTPCCVVATVGTTSSTAIDPLPAIAAVTQREGLWLHVDAALAGSAAILPEMRWLLTGVEQVDSLVFNPHKWLFTNFDCSAFFTAHPDALVGALSILPEYLRTRHDDEVVNYRDWNVQLGRRFRALKLWFVLRSYGVEGLRDTLRRHLSLAHTFAEWIDAAPDWQRLAPTPLNTVCFRYVPPGPPCSEEDLDTLNATLKETVNATGRIYLTHTRLRGRYCLRLCVGQTETQLRHVEEAWECLREGARLATRS